jgi:hypothetical protein
VAARSSNDFACWACATRIARCKDLAFVALIFGQQHSPCQAVQFRIPEMLTRGIRQCHSLPECGQG